MEREKIIVESLRHCSVASNSCRKCPSYNQDSGCLDRLHAEAASTLEAQQKRIAELEAERRWIPVGERLPEPEKRVLILTKTKGWNGKEYREIMCGFYEDGNIWCEDSKVAWDWEMKREENYDESRDDYRVPEGWFEELLNHIDDYNFVGIGDVVTDWMPLPEPPKEGA